MIAAALVRREQLTEINAAWAIIADMSFIISGTAMEKLSSIGGTHISRRSLLQAAAAVGSMPVLAMSIDPAWAKMAKTAVAYQDTPHGDQNCANCKFFEPPSSCKVVDGVISPNGWCKLWVKKAS